ncbi:MAG: LysM peptidoglycan-binding domain-containing protein [Gammaproteobacteria bacterium]
MDSLYKTFSKAFIILCAICVTSIAWSATGEGIQVYPKDSHLLPENKQKIADDLSRYRNADNLWDILREEFSLAHYENSPAVQQKIEWYMNNQDFLLRSATRAAPYLYYISQQVKKRHLPAELVLLPIVESGYNPFALSNVGAAGIWQMMPSTASGLGVRQDSWYDGRRDVIASTRAALNYLAYLQSFFEGNWLLAIAAYNTGEGNVLSAIKRNIRDGLDTEFWSLPVAQETKDYVPSLLALATIISHPDQYPIYFPPIRNAPYLAQVDLGTQINLKYAAQLAGISHNKLIQLNPGFTRTSTLSKGPNKLVLPIENVEQFSENLARMPQAKPINWIHYRFRAGDTLASVAKQFNTSITVIKKFNHLGNKNNLRHGTNLLIPYDGISQPETILSDAKKKPGTIATHSKNQANTTAVIASAAKQFMHRASTHHGLLRDDGNDAPHYTDNANYKLQPGDTIYMVRTSDTLASIAKRFHTSSYALMAANKLSGKKIQPGKQMIIPTHSPNHQMAERFATKDNDVRPGDTIYMVRRGDTIEKIANKFHTSPAAIRLTNLVDNSSLAEGEKIVIPTHMKG